MRSDHSQSQHDEGYSEDPNGSPRSEDTDMGLDTDFELAVGGAEALDVTVRKLVASLLTLPPAKRNEIVQVLIPTLPNACKEEISALIERLTHFDPTIYLPNEIVLHIFSYLTPAGLLCASRVSRAWRTRAQDERLWRLCFAREGWLVDRKQIDAFERLAEKRGRKVAEGILKNTSKARADTEGRPPRLESNESRKRGRDEAFREDESMLLEQVDEPQSIEPTNSALEERPANVSDDEKMEGVEAMSTSSVSPLEPSPAEPSLVETVHHPAAFNVAPAIFQPATTHPYTPKLSWPYLYKQRRRLELNWEKGDYKMFQLPHPDHLDEGHEECVYTIQHTPRHLVSGSRDKSIRIWDLETQRLKMDPLCGHEASVLCLQFDERPEQDIIVSGGSDACVLVWKFSTGEIIKKLASAHNESVLNLRFDDRYIVTCSKDKTIKVWTRHALARDSPLIPQHVLHDFASAREPGAGQMIAEYTLLTTLLGHAAAVNAVMIHGNTIVSASGDRYIKSWDLSTGQFKKSYSGHTKGIACVQFDGRRIVSGSSDNTVRIFDAEKQAEIACLTGHSNLVRTVQARFGDLDTVTDAELEAEARQADRGFYAAVARGLQPASVSRRHGGGVRNPGSSRPEAMLAVGTKIPPGGGGSRWAKIVSGSYDESVIVWKRDVDGSWVPRLKLRQDSLLRPPNSRRAAAPGIVPQANANGTPALAHAQAHHHLATAHGHLAQANHLLHAHQQQGQGAPANHLASIANNVQHHHQQLMQSAQQQAQSQVPHTGSVQNPNGTTTTHQQHISTTQNGQVVNGAAAAPAAGPANPGPQQHQAGPAPAGVAAGAGAAPHGHHREGRDSNRVFKLQFDARRIICCSQNKVIVGWDFANGDPELERVGEWSLETA